MPIDMKVANSPLRDALLSSLVSGTTAAGHAGADPFTYLSADSLLTYCQTNLRSLDDTMKQYMANQKGNLELRKACQDVSTYMANTFDVHGPKTAEQWAGCADRVTALKDLLPPNDPRRAKLDELAGQLRAGTQGASDENVSHWKDMRETLTTMSDEIKSGSELEMIELQSVVSQRQTVVQLTTSILSKLNETMQSIVQKI